MEYLVIFEETGKSVGAYVPDLPGCVAVAATRAEAKQLIREAIQLHIASLREHGEAVPRPHSSVELIAVSKAG
jgi:predicted RNase H-like HicB family nuclease